MYFREPEKECHIPLLTVLSKPSVFFGESAVNLFLHLVGGEGGSLPPPADRPVTVYSISVGWSQGCVCECKDISHEPATWGHFCRLDTGSGVDFGFQCVFRGKYTTQRGINIYCLFFALQNHFYPPALLSLCGRAAASAPAAEQRKTLILLTNSLA